MINTPEAGWILIDRTTRKPLGKYCTFDEAFADADPGRQVVLTKSTKPGNKAMSGTAENFSSFGLEYPSFALEATGEDL